MLAAEQDQTEQELPKSICQPWHVTLFVLVLNATRCNALKTSKAFSENSRAGRASADQLRHGRMRRATRGRSFSPSNVTAGYLLSSNARYLRPV